MSFAVAAAALHPRCLLDVTVHLVETAWRRKFGEVQQRIAALRTQGHAVRFGVDALQESCRGYGAVFFNFPHVDGPAATRSDGGAGSGELAGAFLRAVASSADPGTLVVLGLLVRGDGRACARLYGSDPHAVVAGAVAASRLPGAAGAPLEDALAARGDSTVERLGILADRGFYGPYEKAGYQFTPAWAPFEANEEWHAKTCFVLRVGTPPSPVRRHFQ